METKSAVAGDGEQAPSLASRCIHALLQRHDIRKHRQVTVLSEILGVAYQTVYRRLPSGDWSLAELERIAAHFGESVAQLLEAFSESATFVVGGLRLPCRVEVGGRSDPAKPSSLIAVKGDKEWIVMLSSDALTAQTHDIQRLIIEPRMREDSRIAVLDDSPQVAESICLGLKDMGFVAEPFFSIESMNSALKTKHFDAYIIDWIIGKTTARKMIATIRAADPHCPIAILTGQLDVGGIADETEISLVSAGDNMQFYTKPLPIQIIGQRLRKALGLVRAAGPSRDER